LHPAQLEAAQEEQPEDMEWVVPSLERDTPLKHENSFSTSFDWQSGHSMPFSEAAPNTSFSNSAPHFVHLYSKIGMIPSNHSALNPVMLPQSQEVRSVKIRA